MMTGPRVRRLRRLRPAVLVARRPARQQGPPRAALRVRPRPAPPPRRPAARPLQALPQEPRRVLQPGTVPLLQAPPLQLRRLLRATLRRPPQALPRARPRARAPVRPLRARPPRPKTT